MIDLAIEVTSNQPERSGIYLARSKVAEEYKREGYDVLVSVHGTAPFLVIKGVVDIVTLEQRGLFAAQIESWGPTLDSILEGHH